MARRRLSHRQRRRHPVPDDRRRPGKRRDFENVGDTRRAGLELGLGEPAGRVQWSVNYSYISATFEDAVQHQQPESSRGMRTIRNSRFMKARTSQAFPAIS